MHKSPPNGNAAAPGNRTASRLLSVEKTAGDRPPTLIMSRPSGGIDNSGGGSSTIPSRFLPSLTTISKHVPSNTSTATASSASSPPQPKSCITTLSKMLDNILAEHIPATGPNGRTRPYNPKTRSVRLTNRVFCARVASVDGGVEFLEACGFKRAGSGGAGSGAGAGGSASLLKLAREDESVELLTEGRMALRVFIGNGMKIVNDSEDGNIKAGDGAAGGMAWAGNKDEAAAAKLLEAAIDASAGTAAPAPPQAPADANAMSPWQRVLPSSPTTAADSDAKKVDLDNAKSKVVGGSTTSYVQEKKLEPTSDVEATATKKGNGNGDRIDAGRLETDGIASEEKAEQQRIIEAARIASAEKAEQERVEAERIEAERIAAEKAEQERIIQAARIASAEKAEQERVEAERIEAERIAAAEKAEQERIIQAARIAAAEKAEQERVEGERIEAERIAAAEKAEQERIIEAARIAAAEKAEQERVEGECIEAERIAAAEKAEQERIEAERIAAAEKAEQERMEAERIAAAEKAEQERIIEAARIAAAEKAEQERVEGERIEAERIAAAEKAEQERIEAERIAAAEKAELERTALEKAEEKRLEAERMEAKRLAAEKAEQGRIDARKAEQEQSTINAADMPSSNATAVVPPPQQADDDGEDAALLAEIEAEMDSDGEDYACSTAAGNVAVSIPVQKATEETKCSVVEEQVASIGEAKEDIKDAIGGKSGPMMTKAEPTPAQQWTAPRPEPVPLPTQASVPANESSTSAPPSQTSVISQTTKSEKAAPGIEVSPAASPIQPDLDKKGPAASKAKQCAVDPSIDIDNLIDACVGSAATPTAVPKRSTRGQSRGNKSDDDGYNSSGTMKVSNIIGNMAEKVLAADDNNFVDSFDRVVAQAHGDGVDAFDKAVEQAHGQLPKHATSTSMNDSFASLMSEGETDTESITVKYGGAANDSAAWDDQSSLDQIQSQPRAKRRASEVLRDLSSGVGGSGPASAARRKSVEQANQRKEGMYDSFRALERKFATCPLPDGISNADSTLIRKGLRMCFAAFAMASPSTPFEGLGEDVQRLDDDDDEISTVSAPRLKLIESEKNFADLPDFPSFNVEQATDKSSDADAPSEERAEIAPSHHRQDVQHAEVDMEDTSGDENNVPSEVANLIWAAVLGLEDGDEDDSLPSISGSAAAIASSVLRYIVSRLDMGVASPDEQLAAVGDFFRDSLVSLGVLKVVSSGKRSAGVVGASSYRPRELLSFPHDAHWRYGLYLASTEFDWPQGSSPGWAGDFVRKLFRRVALSQDYAEDVSGPIPDGNNVYGWYAARNLPHHMVKAGQWDEVEKLLTDLAFVNFRMRTCGPVLGTTLHISDCNKLSRCFCAKEEDAKDAAIERGRKASYMAFKFASLYVHRIIRKLGSEKDSGKDDDIENHDGTVSTFFYPSDLPIVGAVGHSLHLLGVSFGEIHRPNDEIIHYEEALNLKKTALREAGDHESVADTLHCIGVHHQSQGEFFAAMSCYDKTLRLYKTKSSAGSLKMSRTLHNIGVIYCERGEFDVALNCFEQSLQIRRSRLGDTDKSVADTQCWIGKVYREKGEYDAALERFQRAFEAKEAILGPDDLDVAEALQNIGIIYDDMEEYEDSLDCYRRCLEIRRSKLGDRHEDVCEVLACMANVYHASGDVEKGLEFFTLALKLRDLNLKNVEIKKGSQELKTMLQSYEDVYVLTKAKLDEVDSNDAEQFLRIKDELAVLRLKQGNVCDRANEYTKTIKCYLKALEIRKEMDDHKNMGNTLNLMGIAHAKRKHYRRAMKCFNDAVKLRKAVLPEDHQDIAETLHNIGHCSAKQGKIDLAMDSYKEAYDVKAEALGHDTLSAVKTLHCIGMLHEQRGEYDEAQKCYENALDVRRAALGNDHLEVAYSLHSLGKIFKRQQDLKEAKECLTESLQIKLKNLPASHISIAESLHQMALIHNENGKKEEALHCLRTALSTCESNLGDHPLTAEVLESFAQVYESRGDHTNALSYLKKALEMKENMYGEDSLSRSDTLYAIGKIKEKKGDLDGTLLTFKEVMEIRTDISGRNSLGVAAVLNDVGVVQLRRKEYEIASRCFEDSMEVWKAQLEEGHEFIGETLVNMGELNGAKMDFAAAVENYVEAIDIFKTKRGATDLSVAFVYNKLGETLVRLEEFNNAVEAYQQCLSIRTLALGTDSLQVASVNSDLGSVYHILGQQEEAKQCLKESLRVMKDKVRASDDKLADTLYTMGKVLMKMKCRDEAFTHFQDALKIRKKRYSDEDLLVANVLGEMGSIHDARHDYEKALACYNECLRVRQMHLGNCESVGDMFHKIGTIDQILQDFESALDNFLTALGIYKSVLGEESPSVAKTVHNLGLLYDAQNDLHTAMKYHKEAHRLRKLHFGEDSLKVAVSLDSIAGIYQKQNQNDKALKCLTEALRIRTLKLGKDHVEVGTTLFGMGIVFSDMGDLDKAMECYNASLNIRRKKHGGSSVEVAQTLHNMGSVYAMKEDYTEALQYWRNSLGKYREAGLPDDHHMVATTLQNIVIAANYLEEQEHQLY